MSFVALAKNGSGPMPRQEILEKANSCYGIDRERTLTWRGASSRIRNTQQGFQGEPNDHVLLILVFRTGFTIALFPLVWQ